ncbi:MAG TPA: adenosine kinase [bacterium]|nr:adenosine kinase [bacterium]
MKSIIGMGNALVDILVSFNDDTFLEDVGIAKGSMQLVDLSFSNRILKKIEQCPLTTVSGGSASNTIHGLSGLGVSTGFIGKISEDKYGLIFREDLLKNGIEPRLFTEGPHTGRAIAMISPDSERTFATYLGSAVKLNSAEITSDIFKGYDCLHIEGYLVQNHELLEKALLTAKKQGLLISLDLASYNIVQENLEFLQEMVGSYVDILFANEEEALAFTGLPPEEAVEKMGQNCKVAVVKKGAAGSVIYHDGNMTHVGSISVKALDTTGAGDLYASGFLYGVINDMQTVKCGMMGSLLAGKVIEQVGAKIPEKKWNEIYETVRTL